jgi:predicted DNA-binding protein (MmcQ/YjbR family)
MALTRDITARMNVDEAVRKVCLSFPEAEERPSHGSPDFRVRGKSFASYMVNHHGDGRVALWLTAQPGAQQAYCEAEPKHFFVPPYVGPRGWLGVNLDKGLSWKRIAELVREAYTKVAPPSLADTIGKTIVISGRVEPLTAEQKDPLQAERAQEVLKRLRALCLALPETTEKSSFGTPAFHAGKKAFAHLWPFEGKLRLLVWVGVAGQSLVTLDPRFSVPPYMGHNGWIGLDVSKRCDWDEIRELLVSSYRHFALTRMLKALDAPPPSPSKKARKAKNEKKR